MSVKMFVRDKALFLGCMVIQMIVVVLFGTAFQIPHSFLGAALFLEVLTVVCCMAAEFHKKQRFYHKMYQALEELDRKYLITEMIQEPDFAEGKIFCDALYETDKSMNERVNEMEQAMCEFKEYVEMWIHEIKIPISALSLMNYNEKSEHGGFHTQVGKISDYVEQILFYVRADAPQKDFLMKRTNLEQIINGVLLEQKDQLIGGHFTIEKENTDVEIVSDAKWLRFMLGQIISNSVKYKRGQRGYLKFAAEETGRQVSLTIEDHGIGVPKGDLERVFDKSFTGANGRRVAASTGMGLYICKKMCRKLGHSIHIESQEGKYTRVSIDFGRDGYHQLDENK